MNEMLQQSVIHAAKLLPKAGWYLEQKNGATFVDQGRQASRSGIERYSWRTGMTRFRRDPDPRQWEKDKLTLVLSQLPSRNLNSLAIQVIRSSRGVIRIGSLASGDS
jgi:hypothetical protein